MAIALDTTATGGVNNTGATFTMAPTIGGTASVLIVGISYYSATAVSSVAIGATGFTKILTQTSTSVNTVRCDMWYLAGPPTGSQTITVTLNATCPASGYVMSFTGTPTTSGAIGAHNNTTVTVHPVSPSLTTTASNSWIVDCLALDLFWTPTTVVVAGSNTQQVAPHAQANADNAGSTLAATTITGYTAGWTWTEGSSNSGAAYGMVELMALGPQPNVFDASTTSEGLTVVQADVVDLPYNGNWTQGVKIVPF